MYSRLRSLTTVFLMRELSSPVLVYSGSQVRILVSGHLRVKSMKRVVACSSLCSEKLKSCQTWDIELIVILL